jgi:hypothetical protein
VSTKLLAEKNGNISIVNVHRSTKTYLVFRYAMESNDCQLPLKSQGKEWQLFLNVEDATAWIEEQNKPPVKIVQPGSREWFKREKEVINSYAPQIVACNNCGSPRHKQYKCMYCEKE